MCFTPIASISTAFHKSPFRNVPGDAGIKVVEVYGSVAPITASEQSLQDSILNFVSHA